MFSKILVAATIGLAGLAAATPLGFPPSKVIPRGAEPSESIQQIELAAHGSLPNGAPPPHISDDSLTSLRLIAFNELFEVAFFTELIYNITNNVPGYQVGNGDADCAAKKAVLESLAVVQAQEELHALDANGAIVHFNGNAIQPCKYTFPVDNFVDAIALASTFTDVVLGTLQDVVTLFGTDGDSPLIRGVASVIGQEGEQNGYYRTILNKTASALPFLTASTREFAFSALQGFVVPGSCPNIGDIKLAIFEGLTLESQDIRARAQHLKFSFATQSNPPASYTAQVGANYEKVRLVYINQQNLPVYEKPEKVVIGDGKVEFEAFFPFNGTTFGNGLTIAVLASGPPVSSVDEVAQNTLYGPAIIEIN